jgi:putative oxidoreductase
MVLRLSLGIVFVYSSVPKILNPSDFATILYGYSIFPLVLINLIAIVFPFIELISGLSLIFGVYFRSTLIIINFLIIFFIVIISFNLLRGHEFNCGCFAVGDPDQVSAAGQLLIRDFVLLIIGLYLFFSKLSVHYKSET